MPRSLIWFGVRRWPRPFAPDAVLPETRPASAHLLSTFDEAFLTYRRVGFPRSVEHPAGASAYRFAEAGGGVVSGLRDVGRWNGCWDEGQPGFSLNLDLSRDAGELTDIEAA